MSGTRRGNRDSWIRETPNDRGYYEARVWMGTKADGKPDRRHTERKTLKAVRAWVRKLERQRDAGIAASAGRVRTVQEMLTRHLDVVLPQRGRAPLTLRSYESLCREHIYPLWGGQKIDRLLPEHIEDGYAAMLGDGLSAGSVRKIHAILSSAYEIEVKRGNVARNPCRLVEPPRLGQPDKKALNVVQARAVIASVEETPERRPVGDRPGVRHAPGRDARPAVAVPGYRRPGRRTGRDARVVAAPAAPVAARVRGPARLLREPAQAAVPASDARRSGRPAAGTPASRPEPKDCARRAARGMRRNARSGSGGGLVFREIKERRRKTIPVPWPLVKRLRAAPCPAETRATGRGERVGGLRRRLRPGERAPARSARRLAGVVGHPRCGGHRARGHARHAALGGDDRVSTRARRWPWCKSCSATRTSG